MRIYIPTYKRITKQLTIANLPTELHPTITVVCPEDEVLYHRHQRPNIAVLAQPATITTIAQKRAWIIQQAPESKILMLDDDLEFHARGNGQLTKGNATRQRLLDFFQEFSNKLDVYAHVGISPRQGNNRLEGDWIENTRMNFALGYQTEIARKHIQFNRVDFREDFDYTLQLLKAGFPNVVAADVAVSPATYHSAGGCWEERTVEKSNAAAELLAELHPGLVRVADKEYKSSLPRKEVVISWKKAYELGKAAKNG